MMYDDAELIWQIAVSWIQQTHEKGLSTDKQQELMAWLKENPAHQIAYDDASHIWLLCGLIPSRLNITEEDILEFF